LKEMAHTTMPSIEVNCVGGAKPVHPLTQIGFPRLGYQMVVITH